MKTNKMSAIFSNQHEYEELRPLTDERSLSTLYFAGKYRLMDFPLSSIVNAGINNVYTLINQEKVRSYFDHLGGGKEWGLDTIGSYEYMDFYQRLIERQAVGEPYYSEIIRFLKTADYPYTAFIGNKMVGNFDLEAVLHYHKVNHNKITPIFKKTGRENIAPDDEIFTLDKEYKITNNIRGIDIESQKSYNLSVNAYVIDTEWLIEELEKGQKSGEPVDFAHKLAKLARKQHASAYEYTGYLRNIHNIKSYYDANMDMLDAAKRDSLLYGNQKIITRIRNEVGTYYCGDSEVKTSMLATGCNICGKVDHSVISRRVNIDENSEVSNSVIMANTHIKAGSKVEHAILDKNVVIEPNVIIQGSADKPVVIKKNSVISENIINN